jgi:tRNA pseudouridine55 synthase
MLGTQWQTPPMVSAKKVGGTRLHELARQGIEVPREAREITVSAFDVVPSDDPAVLRFSVECTVGTYVRVLMSDFAQRIGTLGHLIELRRLSSGTHLVDDALTLRQVDEMVASGASPLRAPSQFVAHLERTTLSDEQETRMRRGQRLDIDHDVTNDVLAAFDGAGELVGILHRREGQWQPELVMASSNDAAHG